MAKSAKAKPIVLADEPPQPIEIMEKAIIDLAAGMKCLGASRLTQETIVLLLHDRSKVGKPDIRHILNCLGQLEEIFLKPRQNKKTE